MYRFSRFLSDTMLVSACCLLMISMVEPFLTNNFVFPAWGGYPLRTRVSVTYWSYKAIVSVGNYHELFIFNNYWFNKNEDAPIVIKDTSMVLITMFLTQIFALVLGLLCLFLREKELRIIPLISSVIAVILMVHTCIGLTNTIFLSSVNYEAGYWLIYVSTVLFLFALILSFTVKTTKTTSTMHTPSHTLT